MGSWSAWCWRPAASRQVDAGVGANEIFSSRWGRRDVLCSNRRTGPPPLAHPDLQTRSRCTCLGGWWGKTEGRREGAAARGFQEATDRETWSPLIIYFFRLFNVFPPSFPNSDYLVSQMLIDSWSNVLAGRYVYIRHRLLLGAISSRASMLSLCAKPKASSASEGCQVYMRSLWSPCDWR